MIYVCVREREEGGDRVCASARKEGFGLRPRHRYSAGQGWSGDSGKGGRGRSGRATWDCLRVGKALVTVCSRARCRLERTERAETGKLLTMLL